MTDEARSWIPRLLVLGGLVMCGTVAAWDWPASRELPGMALGSPTVLVAERTAVLFGVWLVLVVVAWEAWLGRLPIEVSGRGVKYADAAAGQALADQTDAALRRLDEDVGALRREIADLDEIARLGKRD